MDESKNYVDERIEKWFKLIEQKLRTSFQAAKADNTAIKASIVDLKKLLTGRNSKDKDNEKFMSEVTSKLEELSKKINKNGFDLKSIDIERIDKKLVDMNKTFAKASEINVLKKSIETSKQQKADIRKEVTSELYDIFEKKIDARCDKYAEKAKETRKDVAAYRKSSEARIESLKHEFDAAKRDYLNILEKERREHAFALKQERAQSKAIIYAERKSLLNAFENGKEEIRHQKNDFSKEFNHNKENIINLFESNKQEMLSQTKKVSGSMKREVSGWKNYFSSRLDEDLKQRDEKIQTLERQISYLKGRINLLLKGKFKEAKELVQEEKKQGLFASLIDSLADDGSDNKKVDKKGKKAGVEIVKTKEVKAKAQPVKAVKKLERHGDKGFFDKIVNSLSDK